MPPYTSDSVERNTATKRIRIFTCENYRRIIMTLFYKRLECNPNLLHLGWNSHSVGNVFIGLIGKH